MELDDVAAQRGKTSFYPHCPGNRQPVLKFFLKENTEPNQQEDKFDWYRYTARSHTST